MVTLTTDEKINILWTLFVHQPDTYAEQWYDPERGGGYGRKKLGRCVHSPSCQSRRVDCPDIQYLPLTRDALIDHLRGDITVATYAHNNDTVKWVCLDIDIRKGETGDVKQLTYDTASFLITHLPRNSFRVENSGGRGFHIWIFFAQPIPSHMAHAFGMWIRAHVEHTPELGIEVYPKQAQILRVGNPVKIPLGIHRKTHERCFFVRGTFEPYENQWEALTTVQPLSFEFMKAFTLRHNIREVRIEASPDHNPQRDMPCMTRVMREGLQEGSRDIGLFRLAVFLKDRGLPYETTVTVLEETNSKSDDPLDDVELKAQSAYSNDYAVFPCFDPAFDEYCSSSCKYFSKKKYARGQNNPLVIKKLSRD